MHNASFSGWSRGAAAAAAVLVGVFGAFGQSRNNPYSPSPDKQGPTAVQVASSESVTFRMRPETQPPAPPVTIAHASLRVQKPAAARVSSPSEIYKIGVGDVLFVNLKNAPNGSGYFTVRPDGTIDYPLAGEGVIVADQTVEVAQEIIESGIKLFASPDVQVKVRQYASHKITVTGTVENPGEKYLQREAIPLFAIRAEALPAPKTTKVRIKRVGSSSDMVLDLGDLKSDETLIFPGDHLTFIDSTAGGSYFISGQVASGGQKELTGPLTLYQAVTAAGGAKGDPKKAIVRRKNAKGMLESIEHNLHSIKSGKSIDPYLASGDIIEIKD